MEVLAQDYIRQWTSGGFSFRTKAGALARILRGSLDLGFLILPQTFVENQVKILGA
jgi:hypothetical protein